MTTRAATQPGKDTRRPRRLPASLDPVSDHQFGYDQARHLLWRAGFGGTPEQVQTLVGWGPRKSVDYLLDFDAAPYEEPTRDAFDPEIMRPDDPADIARYRAALRAGNEDVVNRFRQARQLKQRRDREQIRRIQRWWLARMIETPRPLEEKLTLFWHGHFATSYRTIENSYHMYLQNMLFRRHAAGNFGDLLFAIIRDPAMLAYLDNNDSSRRRPNENLARELMELFSLGVGNYSERDIKEGARALTGYSFRHNDFIFIERNHDSDIKSILGRRGRLDGDAFVEAILGQRTCAQFISAKLYAYFCSTVPLAPREMNPQARAVVQRMTGLMLKSRYDLKPALRALFLSEHFYHPAIMGEQIKSPAQLVVGAVRSLNAPVRDLDILLDAMNLMGQSLFFPPSVKGWVGGRSWVNTSTLFVRQNILAYMLTGKKPVGYDALADEQKYDPEPLLAPLAQADASAAHDPGRVVDYLLRFTLGSAPEPARASLGAFVDTHGGVVQRDTITALLLLITAMPEYQLC